VRAIVLAGLIACGAAPTAPVATTTVNQVAPNGSDAPHRPDPDLERVPVPKLLAIDWDKLALGSDADALALWKQIDPHGADWQEKLYEVPAGEISQALAKALLRQGNFTCVHQVPVASCPKRTFAELDTPIDTADFNDPCLRRGLALWAFDQLNQPDLEQLRPALDAIAAIPPPESDLVEDALRGDHDNPDQTERVELLVRAWNAGQRDIAGASIGGLDDQHLVELARKDHVDAALEILSIQDQRAVFLAAMTDPKLEPKTRMQVVADLLDAQPTEPGSDGRAALLAAAKSTSCEVAAAAAHALVKYHILGAPKPPATMRTLCVVASYEQLQQENETSPLSELIPARGLELVRVTNDPDAGSDARSIDLIPSYAAVFPESDDIVRAFEHCKSSTCVSEEHEFHFTIRGGLLTRLEIDDRPDCAPSP
jgi:hypothetical protein